MQVHVPAVDDRVPVVSSGLELKRLLDSTGNDRVVALFLAHRGSKAAWDTSITRVTLNLVDDHFFYIPVEVAPEGLSEIYAVAQESDTVFGLNHTTPHKNNVHLRKLLQVPGNDIRSIDTAIRYNEKFEGSELNGRSFAAWFLETFGEQHLQEAHFLIRGGGGAGSAIARYLALELAISNVTIVERDEQTLSRLRTTFPKLQMVSSLDFFEGDDRHPTVLIEATGARDMPSQQELTRFLDKHSNSGMFVDLRTATHRPLTSLAASLGWAAYDGGGMSINNDWQLIVACMDAAGYRPRIRFEDFRDLSKEITQLLVR